MVTGVAVEEHQLRKHAAIREARAEQPVEEELRGGELAGGPDLRVGDLVFFGSRNWRHVHHVGVYAGHGWLLHAPHTGTVVQVTRLRAFPDYWGARRLVPVG